MNTRFRLALVALAVATPLVVAPLGAAMAQSAPDDSVITSGPKKPSRPNTPRALPGARAERPDAAPLERPPSEMKPNEALFDAINRGDLAATRDAIGRGAQLDQPNILGLMPVDLAIDLGHNDITFLLLSMRGAAGTSAARTAVAPQATLPAGTKAAPAAAKPVAVAPPKPARVPQQVAAPAAPRPVTSLHYVATDPGTPVPQSGFLGFGRTQP